MKKTATILCALLLCLLCSACCLSHDWAPADCTEPETCTRCEKTRGEALGHQWSEATCMQASTCAVCGATQGEALGHAASRFEEAGKNLAEAVILKASYCRRCGELVGETTEKMEKLYDEQTGLFLFTPEEFYTRMLLLNDGDYAGMCDQYQLVKVGDEAFVAVFLVFNNNGNENRVGYIFFQNKNGEYITDLESREIAIITLSFIEQWFPSEIGYTSEEGEELTLEIKDPADVLWHFGQAEAAQLVRILDPKNVDAEALAQSFQEEEFTEHNDLRYLATVQKEQSADYTCVALAPATELAD